MTEQILIGLGLHMIGDYITQNHWVANHKTMYSSVAMFHATLYALPFMLLIGFNIWWIILWLTHFFIDRYRLAQYWIRLVNWNWESKNFGFPDDTPAYLSAWLLFIIDNIFHVIINTICIIQAA